MQLLTNSRAKDFRACNRMHHIRYNLGIQPLEQGETARFGTLWHDGQEAWWNAIKAGKHEYEWLHAALIAIHRKTTDPIDAARAEALMLGYHIRWKNEKYEVLAVEIEFLCDLINPATGSASRTFQVAGKIDAVVRDLNGRVLIVEHKSSGEDIGVGSEYWRRLTLDSQISTYFRGTRSLGFEVEGCLYDVIAKPRQQLLQATPAESRKYTKKTGELYAYQRDRDETIDEYKSRIIAHIAENPDRYFQRGDVVRLPEDEEDAAYDAWQTARSIRDAQVADRHPRNPDACSRYNRTCAYFDVCCRLASLDDATRFERVANPHKELIQVTAKPVDTYSPTVNQTHERGAQTAHE